MCGRFSQFSEVETIARAFGAVADDGPWPPAYNLAPGMTAGIAVADGPHRRLTRMRWGLVPAWAKDPAIGYRMINARSETVAEKPSFGRAFRHRRCLVPADGFFEWHGKKGQRQPWFIHAPDRQLLAIAGLWERWVPPGGDAPWYTFTIMTTAAVGSVAAIHHRMPVILRAGAHDRWLSGEPMGHEDLAFVLRRYLDADLARYPVSTAVNAARNNTAACIVPEGPHDAPPPSVM